MGKLVQVLTARGLAAYLDPEAIVCIGAVSEPERALGQDRPLRQVCLRGGHWIEVADEPEQMARLLGSRRLE